MIISAQAIDFVDVNHYSICERLDLQQGNGGDYYLQLVRYEDGIIPPSGPGLYAQSANTKVKVRYIPPAGAVVAFIFPRTLSIAATPSNQDVTVTGAAVAGDTSMYKITLSPAQVDKIVSEGAKVTITVSGVTQTWPIDHLVRRRSNVPGA